MADSLANFFVEIGFAPDLNSLKKTEAVHAKTEARLTDATKRALADRQQAYLKGMADRVNAVTEVGGELEAEEKAAAAHLIKIDKDRLAEQAKLEAEAAKKGRERREATFKSIRSNMVGIVAAATKATLAVEATALGVVFAVDRAAKGFERLNYLGRQSGASPQGLSVFGFAASQLGSNAGAADSAMADFGGRIKNFKGYREALSRLIGNIYNGDGSLQDTSDLATRLGHKLRDIQGQRGFAAARAQASVFGFEDYGLLQAMMDPRFAGFEADRRAQQARIGADPNAAATASTGFEQSFRHLQSIFEDVATKVETVLATRLKPQLDELAFWVERNAGNIASFATTISQGVLDLTTALAKSDAVKAAATTISDGLEKLAAYVGTDAFKADVKQFAADIAALAKAVKSALQLLGIIPSSQPSFSQVSSFGGLGTAFGQAMGWIGGSAPGGSGGASPFDRARGGSKGLPLPKGAAAANARESYAFWRSKGLSHEGAMGMVAQEGGESAFNPHGPAGDGGTAIGSFQWHADRRANILAGTGIDVTDPRTTHKQMLEAAYWELSSGNERASWNALQRARSVEEGVAAGVGFERPGDRGAAISTRTALARAIEADVQRQTPSNAPDTVATRISRRQPPIWETWRNVLDVRNLTHSSQPLMSRSKEDVLASATYNSRTMGDVVHNPTFNITSSGSPQQALDAARFTAGRGLQDVLRNVQGAEQ